MKLSVRTFAERYKHCYMVLSIRQQENTTSSSFLTRFCVSYLLRYENFIVLFLIFLGHPEKYFVEHIYTTLNVRLFE